MSMLNRTSLSARLALVLVFVYLSGSSRVVPGQAVVVAQANAPGQTVTRLADGRWLFVGGDGTLARAAVWDPVANTSVPTTNQLLEPRAWHSATVLPDGMVLIFGGRDSNGQALAAPELFDPVTATFQSPLSIGTAARFGHTATLLTDGRVLIVGGSDGLSVVEHGEILDPLTFTSQSVTGLHTPRTGHQAVLTAEGWVRLTGGAGRRIQDEVYDPAQNRWSPFEQGQGRAPERPTRALMFRRSQQRSRNHT
jgi:hypothetical protein